jgi:hypothetical protein
VEAILQTKFQGLTTRLKNEAWKVDVLHYEGFKTRDGFWEQNYYYKKIIIISKIIIIFTSLKQLSRMLRR